MEKVVYHWAKISVSFLYGKESNCWANLVICSSEPVRDGHVDAGGVRGTRVEWESDGRC